MKIAVVEDVGFVRELLSNIILESGHHLVAEVSCADDMLSALESTKIDVLILDLVLPDKNGIELAEEILKNYPGIKIIACSSLEQDFVKQKVKNLGCYFLEKPFTKRSVLSVLDLCRKDFDQAEGKQHHG